MKGVIGEGLFNRKDHIENMISKKNDPEFFSEEVIKAMGKVENIIENANRVALARHILETFILDLTYEEILEESRKEAFEEEIKKLCGHEDPAVIVALCVELRRREKDGSNKDLN
jgi:hypothetical protein